MIIAVGIISVGALRMVRFVCQRFVRIALAVGIIKVRPIGAKTIRINFAIRSRQE